MLNGDVLSWIYKYIGGIQSDPDQPGFKNIIICPKPIAGLDFAKTSYSPKQLDCRFDASYAQTISCVYLFCAYLLCERLVLLG